MSEPHPNKLTPSRIAWLIQLRDHGPAKRPRGQQGYYCMRQRWTDWQVQKGAEYGLSYIIQMRYADPFPWQAMTKDGWEFTGLEVITPLGLLKLRQAAQ